MPVIAYWRERALRSQVIQANPGGDLDTFSMEGHRSLLETGGSRDHLDLPYRDRLLVTLPFFEEDPEAGLTRRDVIHIITTATDMAALMEGAE